TITEYTKLFWINSGPYNNLTARKFVLTCTPEAFAAAARSVQKAGGSFAVQPGETLDDLLLRLEPMFFDPRVDPQVTTNTPPEGRDILARRANNLYVDVTMKDLEDFCEAHPLNSRVVKSDGVVTEEIYRLGGRYTRQIGAIIGHLKAAIPCAS